MSAADFEAGLAVAGVVLIEGALNTAGLEHSIRGKGPCLERLAWPRDPDGLFNEFVRSLVCTPRTEAWRFGLARMSEGMHLLLLGAHPAGATVSSMQTVLDEVIAAYADDAAPSPTRMQAIDAVARQQTRLDAEPVAFRVGRASHVLPARVVEQLERLAERQDTTLTAVLLACWLGVLPKLTGDADLFLDPPLLCRIQPRMSFAEILACIGPTPLHADSSQHGIDWTPRDHRADDMHAPVLFEHYPGGSTGIARGAQFVVRRLFACTRRFQIKLSTWTRDDALVIDLYWDASRVAANQARMLLSQYSGRLEESLARAGASGVSIPLVPAHEWHAILRTFNRTDASPPADTYCRRFDEQVARTPEAVAVRAGSAVMSYRALDRAATRLAQRLVTYGVGPEVCVGLYLTRSPQLPVAVLAVLKSGGACVLLDPGASWTFVQSVATDAQPAVIVTTADLADAWHGAAAHVLRLDAADESEAHAAATAPLPTGKLEHLACVIYPSEPSAEPTGVQIEQRVLMNYLQWAAAAYGGAENGLPEVHTLPGGITVTSVLLPWLLGQTLEMQPATASRRQHAPPTRRVREYAPADTALGCCVYAGPSGDVEAGPAPIGRPIPSTQAYVLDPEGQPTPPGLSGELYIGGAAVARGYVRRPTLTAARFVPDPFSGAVGARLYRTGDRVRHRLDGQLEYLGRGDLDPLSLRNATVPRARA
jgi:acyl-CoA synthetase (AMP-forming)/AMP-acid ligase II